METSSFRLSELSSPAISPSLDPASYLLSLKSRVRACEGGIDACSVEIAGIKEDTERQQVTSELTVEQLTKEIFRVRSLLSDLQNRQQADSTAIKEVSELVVDDDLNGPLNEDFDAFFEMEDQQWQNLLEKCRGLTVQGNNGTHIQSEFMPHVLIDDKTPAPIVVIASCNIDLATYCHNFPQPGETINAPLFKKGFGGKGANQCVAISRLGRDSNSIPSKCLVAAIATVGNDSFGQEYLLYFASQNIETSFMRMSNFKCNSALGSTGVATILVNNKGENIIAVVGGANECTNELMIAEAEIETTLRQATIVVCQLEIPIRTAVAAFTTVKNLYGSGSPCPFTILNMAPAPTSVAAIPSIIWSLVDVIIVNVTEAMTLAEGIELNDDLSGSSDDATDDFVLKSALSILHRGCKHVIVTLGSKGAMVVTASSSPMLDYVCGPPVGNVVDTTGAGDAFVGALSFHLVSDGSRNLCDATVVSNHNRLVAAAQYACTIAGLTVTKQGTQSSYPYRDELPESLRRGE